MRSQAIKSADGLKRIDQADFDHRAVTGSTPTKAGRKQHPSQLQLFTSPGHPLAEKLRTIDLDNMTPRQALDQLYQLKGLLEKK